MWKLTHEGKYVKDYGSPEFRVYNLVDPENGVLFEILIQELGKVAKYGYEQCLKDGYLEYDSNKKRIIRIKDFENDLVQFYLNEIYNGFIFSKSIMNMLKKRSLIENSNL